MMNTKLSVLFLIGTLALAFGGQAADWVVYKGDHGPGLGKRIVLIAGDEEYRSEEALPMLAQILAVRHGFTCTVLFATDPKTGFIDPNNHTNIVGLDKLKTADMMVLFTRFREWPDKQMKYFVDFVNSGKPILGIRTATHAFQYTHHRDGPYAKYDWRSKAWPGGFGEQVLGETWVSHHGEHGRESTRGLINGRFENIPILRGVRNIWGPTDVYTAIHVPMDAKVLVYGLVLSGMHPDDPPDYSKSIMPITWIRHYKTPTGKTDRIICTTIGTAIDLKNEDLRRLLVNACYWGLGMEKEIPPHADVDYVTPYHPTFFGFNQFKRGMKPSDYALPGR